MSLEGIVPELIVPDWPAPSQVKAATTTRVGGVSVKPFGSLNMAGHVGDEATAVAANRQRVVEVLGIPGSPHWLSQVHGTGVVVLDEGSEGLPEGDASTTQQPGCVCAVLTADCLPVLFCDTAGRRVAAAHAGWRGLAAGVLEATAASMQVPGENILAWLGPAIGPRSFEVGEEVYQAFVGQDVETVKAFREARAGHWYADLYRLARRRLRQVGVTQVYGGESCTFEDQQQFYSFRRDGKTGRMASMIWIQPEAN